LLYISILQVFYIRCLCKNVAAISLHHPTLIIGPFHAITFAPTPAPDSAHALRRPTSTAAVRSWAGHRSVPPCLDWYLTHAQICSRVPTPPRRRPPSLPRRRPTSASQGRRAHCAAAIPRAREKKRGNVRARKGERTRASMVALLHPCPPPARHARGRSCCRRGTRAAAAGAARARPFLIADKDVTVSPCNPTLFPATDAMQARLLSRSVHRRNRRSKRVFARCTWPTRSTSRALAGL
jgi:hypothetical protein